MNKTQQFLDFLKGCKQPKKAFLPENFHSRELPISEDLSFIIEKLLSAGFKPDDFVLTGGCVRDLLLGSTFHHDIDVCVNPDLPPEVSRMLDNASFVPMQDYYSNRTYWRFNDLKIDIISNQRIFTEDFDFTINQLCLTPELFITGSAQSWYDIDNRILRFNNVPTLASVLRGLRFKVKHNLVMAKDTEKKYLSVDYEIPSTYQFFWYKELYKAEELGLLQEFIEEVGLFNVPHLKPLSEYYEYLKLKMVKGTIVFPSSDAIGVF